MGKEKGLAERLLKQNGLVAGTATEQERTRFRALLDRDRARARRMKVGAIAVWCLLLACYAGLVLMDVLSPHGAVQEPGYSFLVIQVLFYMALAFSVCWFLRSRSVDRRELIGRLMDLEAKLDSLSRPPARHGGESEEPAQEEDRR